MSDTRQQSSNRIGNSSKRIRKRAVSFGNPALGVYHGFVYTQDGVTAEESSQRPLIEGAVDVHRLVAMVDVPPEQVPEGILNLARSHRPWIDHVRIVIAENDETTTSPLSAKETTIPYSLTPPSPGTSAIENAAFILAAADVNRDDDDVEEEPPSRTYLVLLELSTEEAANVFVEDLHRQPYTSLDETQLCNVYHVIALQGEDGVSLMSPFFAPPSLEGAAAAAGGVVPSSSTSTSGNNNNNPTTTNKNASDDYHCAVCLEHMDLTATTTTTEHRTSILTTVCNHSFHMECLLQWQDSPCPVCRYDHSGLNEALSQCHKCGTTEHNYVCLICGVVSCGGPSRHTTTTTTATAAVAAAAACSSSSSSNNNNQLEHQPLGSHARQHYDRTLHAYALDTETQHVWDFAGQGYVHRLLQNKDDGKLVEVSDPHNTTSQERTLNPGLSEAQEGEMVHRKLEGFASQYYTLLKSQLEQQRIYYEGRLEEIRHEYNNNGKTDHSTTDELLTALRQERHQLSQRWNSLNARCRKVRDDVSFLRNMNESLQANKAPLEQQIAQAQQERLGTRQMFQELLPPLQEKVTRLMLQLESDNLLEANNNDGKKPAAAAASIT